MNAMAIDGRSSVSSSSSSIVTEKSVRTIADCRWTIDSAIDIRKSVHRRRDRKSLVWWPIISVAGSQPALFPIWDFIMQNKDEIIIRPVQFQPNKTKLKLNWADVGIFRFSSVYFAIRHQVNNEIIKWWMNGLHRSYIVSQFRRYTTKCISHMKWNYCYYYGQKWLIAI